MNTDVPYLTFSTAPDHLSARNRSGRTAVLPIYSALEASSKFGTPAKALRTSASILASAAPKVMESLSASGWAERARTRELGPLAKAWRDLHGTAMARQRDLADNRASLLRFPLPPGAGTELRAYLRGLKGADAVKAALTYVDCAAAALELWHASGLPNSMRRQVEDVVIAANLTQRYASSVVPIPRADDLLPTGVNDAALDRLVAEANANRTAASNELELAEIALSRTLDWAGVVADLDRDGAFALMREAQ